MVFALIWGSYMITDTAAEVGGSLFGKQTLRVWGIGDINRKSIGGTVSGFVASSRLLPVDRARPRPAAALDRPRGGHRRVEHAAGAVLAARDGRLHDGDRERADLLGVRRIRAVNRGSRQSVARCFAARSTACHDLDLVPMSTSAVGSQHLMALMRRRTAAMMCAHDDLRPLRPRRRVDPYALLARAPSRPRRCRSLAALRRIGPGIVLASSIVGSGEAHRHDDARRAGRLRGAVDRAGELRDQAGRAGRARPLHDRHRQDGPRRLQRRARSARRRELAGVGLGASRFRSRCCRSAACTAASARSCTCSCPRSA